MPRALPFLLALCLQAACVGRGPGFHCAADDQCGSGGACEPTGWCSFADSSCGAGGRRYGEHAGDGLSRACVAGSSPDAGGTVDAPAVLPDAPLDLPDAPAGEPDAPLATPDAPAATADAPAAPPDAGTLGCVAEIGAGGSHACARRADGTVWCWGWNDHGEVGDGTHFTRSSPTKVTGLPAPAVDLEVGGYHACVRLMGGQVYCWGNNAIGNGDTNLKAAEVPAAAGARSLGAGYASTCAVTADQKVLCWGSNEYGQLGDPTKAPHFAPLLVAGLDGATQVVAGDTQGCALLADGVHCWGQNDVGQLGDKSTNPRATPVRVALDGAVELASGSRHTCARKADGTVWCWGANYSGNLGNPLQEDYSATPLKVGPLGHAVALAASEDSSCALTDDGDGGEIWCWGNNGGGQLGGGEQTYAVPEPVRAGTLSGALQVALGRSHACARLGSGVIACWGSDRLGQLGDGVEVTRTRPAAVDGATGAAALVAGGEHTCLIQAAGGGLQCWGSNDYGQLGDLTETTRSTLAPVFDFTGARAMGAGGERSCAIDADKSLWCWGSNSKGALGNNEADPSGKKRPTPVYMLSGVAQVAVGQYHTCARLDSGDVRCWGDDEVGQLGDGQTAEQHAPGAVVISGASELVAGGFFTCARTGGTVSCWGDNDDGQLGADVPTPRRTPVAVAGLSGVLSITAGWAHACARTASGALCWGRGYEGELGDGNGTASRDPVPVYMLGATKSIEAGGFHTCAVKLDGKVVCWGANDWGQLGNGGMADKLVPTPVLDLAGVADLALGGAHSCARLDGGTVSCWGTNVDGALGGGRPLEQLAPISWNLACP